MKKYFSLASALMLALGMNSCSNDIDEVKAPVEQQPQLHKLYLTATAPNSDATRAYVEGVADKDAIKVTGWKQGDKIQGFYSNHNNDIQGVPDGEFGLVTFTFDETTNMFESEPTAVGEDDIIFVTHGFNAIDVTDPDAQYGVSYAYIPIVSTEDLEVDLDEHFTNIPLFGYAYFSGGNLTADLNLPEDLTLVCIHNNSSEPVDVKIQDPFDDFVTDFGIDAIYHIEAGVKEFFVEWLNTAKTIDEGKAKTIPAGQKAYLPLVANTPAQHIYVNGTKFKTTDPALTAGKVYKLNYPGK